MFTNTQIIHNNCLTCSVEQQILCAEICHCIGKLPYICTVDTVYAENLGRILLDKTRISGAENYSILIRLSADWMGKVDYESEIFLIQRYITLWKGTTASVDIISLSSKLFHDSCFKPAERRKYFFRYFVYVGENSFDLKQVAVISAETCQMVLNFILASICIEKNWGDERILVIPVTWQISAQPLPLSEGPQVRLVTAELQRWPIDDSVGELDRCLDCRKSILSYLWFTLSGVFPWLALILTGEPDYKVSDTCSGPLSDFPK